MNEPWALSEADKARVQALDLAANHPNDPCLVNRYDVNFLIAKLLDAVAEIERLTTQQKELSQQCAVVVRGNARQSQQLTDEFAENAKLMQQLAEARKDSEQYRGLHSLIAQRGEIRINYERDDPGGAGVGGYAIFDANGAELNHQFGQDLGEAIEAARSEGGKGD